MTIDAQHRPDTHTILEWQQQDWQRLCFSFETHKLPHALVITGGDSDSLLHFGQAWLRRLLCTQIPPGKNAFACGACAACDWFLAATHPNYLELSPQAPSRWITVDQARELITFVHQTAASSGPKVILIHPAECMNVNAANALLKTLEEPSAETFLVLLCQQPAKLSATVRSRCQEFPLTTPSDIQMSAWLRMQKLSDEQIWLGQQLAPGAPFEALKLAGAAGEGWHQLLLGLQQLWSGEKSAITLASELCKGSEDSITWVMIVVSVLIRIHFNPAWQIPPELRLVADYSKKMPVGRLIQYLDMLTEHRRVLQTHSGLNAQMVWESILLRWQDLAQAA